MLIHHHQLKTLVEEQHNSNYSALVIAADVDVEGEGSVKYRANIGFWKSLRESNQIFQKISQAELNSAFLVFFSKWKIRVVGKLRKSLATPVVLFFHLPRLINRTGIEPQLNHK